MLQLEGKEWKNNNTEADTFRSAVKILIFESKILKIVDFDEYELGDEA